MSDNYKHLLAPLRVGNHLFKNHIVMTPTTPTFLQQDEKYPAESLATHYLLRAKAASLVTITGAPMFMTQEDRPINLRNDFEFDIEATNQHYMSTMLDGIHAYGTFATIWLQHMFDATYDLSAGVPSFGAPGVNVEAKVTKPEIPVDLIHKSTEDLARRCRLIQKMGFDGVYLHMSYQQSLIARALTPLTNKRTDEYGGCFENRIRLLLETLDAIRDACGRDFIIEGHITGEERDNETGELIPGGWTIDDSVRLAEAVSGKMDILHLRGWNIDRQHPIGIMPDEPPYLYLAEYVKQNATTDTKILSVSGYSDPDLMEEAIAQGKVDIIGVARQLICDPDFITKLYDNRADDIVPCIRCNKCLRVSWSMPDTNRCSVNPRWGFEHRMKNLVEPAKKQKRVAVIGGGPAGMEAAIVCRERGHEVTLFERGNRLGGQLVIGDYSEYKWPLKKLRCYLEHQVNKQGVDVRLNCEATPEMINEGDYDAVVLALGSDPVMLPIPGIDKPHVHTAISTYGREDELPEAIVVVGGGENGIETAMHLANDFGKKVTVLEMTDAIARDAAPFHYRSQMEIVWNKIETLTCITNAKVSAIEDDCVRYIDAEGKEASVPADAVVVSFGSRARLDDVEKFGLCDGRLFVVGDARKAGSVMDLMRTSYFAASQI